MKFLALAALLGASAATTKRDKVFLKDEMTELLELVQRVETEKQSEIFETVAVRKEVLKALAINHPERRSAITLEVHSLKNLVSKVLEEDFEGAVDELEARKNQLLINLLDEEAPAADAEALAAETTAAAEAAAGDVAVVEEVVVPAAEEGSAAEDESITCDDLDKLSKEYASCAFSKG